MTKLTLPTINLNGTTAQQLLEQQLLAIEALRSAISALQAAAPNGRDYQTAPTGAFGRAAAEHLDRFKRLESVRNELEQIAQYVSDYVV